MQPGQWAVSDHPLHGFVGVKGPPRPSESHQPLPKAPCRFDRAPGLANAIELGGNAIVGLSATSP
eukprot:1156244-Lingulodinium_polyedra.AAC.1